MLLQTVTSTGLKYFFVAVFQHSTKNSNNFLKFPISSHLRNCKFSVSTNVELFDEVDMQKYLNYIKSECLGKKFLPKETQHLFSLLERKQELEGNIKSLEKLSCDEDIELKELMESEKKEYLESIRQIKSELLDCLLPRTDNDNRNVELQIIAGIGGQEAKLFSQELFQMYLNYAAFKNWECIGDIKDGHILINGEYVFGNLKYEAGVHRVQRVPVTETSGRTQSSTCSVVILPQPKPHEIVIKEKDIIVEKMRSSGPGGQNVNKRETCVRVKHIPSGVIVENQESRYQYQNLKVAIDKIKMILFNKEQENIRKERLTFKKEQAGENDYSDKIRTYNFQQNRVTDHRVNRSIQNLRNFLSGGKELDCIIEEVKQHELKMQLLSNIKYTLQTAEYKAFEKQQAQKP